MISPVNQGPDGPTISMSSSLPGRIVGDYRLEDPIGHGTFSTYQHFGFTFISFNYY